MSKTGTKVQNPGVSKNGEGGSIQTQFWWAISICCTILCVLKNIVKHIDINIFQKHYQNIESWRKKHNVLHDVLDLRNSNQSYDKSLVKDLKTQKPIKHVERVCIALP